jgi:hypothetical protein
MTTMKTAMGTARLICGLVCFSLMNPWGFIVQRSLGSSSATPCTSPLSSDFYSRFTVGEVLRYKQTNAAGPVLNGTNAFGFTAAVVLSTNLMATNALLTIPGRPQPQPLFGANARFNYVFVTNSIAGLSAVFPSGEYVFALPGKTIPVDLPVVDLPNAPRLSSYDAAQAIDPATNFLLKWDPFSGGTFKDLITVTAFDPTGSTVFKSAEYGCPEALDGTATSVLIPAATLSSNTTYRLQITFVKASTLDTNSIPATALLAGAESQTQTSIATLGGGAPGTFALTDAAELGDGRFRFGLATTPGVIYTVQFNLDLSNGAGWTSLLVTNATSNSLIFTNNLSAGMKTGFFRASHN